MVRCYGVSEAFLQNFKENLVEMLPDFCFILSEYCASRAVPTVSESEYLRTIGNKLLPGIEIFWTGK